MVVAKTKDIILYNNALCFFKRIFMTISYWYQLNNLEIFLQIVQIIKIITKYFCNKVSFRIKNGNNIQTISALFNNQS